jgi:NADH dehydrogenase
VSGHVYDYDHLVMALGAITTYFGIEGLDHFSYGIKSEDEIRKLKQHLYHEMADLHEIEKQYVIVGGGPTGVELASALGAYIKRLRIHHNLPHGRIGITLVEGSPRLLPRMHPTTSKKVQKQLKKLGVHVEVGKRVESATADGLIINGKPLQSHTIIWTSGVANNPFFAGNADHFELAKNGKVVVNEYLRTKDGVHVIGDNAFTPYSGLAQTALHDALFVAKNISRHQKSKRLKKYKAVMPPVVVPVGENWAAFEWRFLRLYGWPAGLLRKAADMIGYHDILPLGRALGEWRAQTVVEDDYFTPAPLRQEN